MGATCNREALVTDSRGSVVQVKSWRKVYLEEFPKVFSPADGEEAWAQAIVELLKDWDQTAELSFTNMQRWGDFLILDLGSPLLKYEAGSGSEAGPVSNMFNMLYADFADNRNPIGALIASFTATYFAQNMDQIQETIDKRDIQQAPYFLSSLAATILKFQHLLTKTALALYANIAILLEKKLEDLEGLLLTCLVQGEMYRLLERLASVLFLTQTETLKCAMQMTHSLSPETLGLTRSKVTALVEMKCREAKDVLLRMASSENLFEKRVLLLLIDKLIREMSSDEGTKRAFLAWVVFKSNLYTLLPQLHLAKLFFSISPSVLPLCYSAIAQLSSLAEQAEEKDTAMGASTKEEGD